MTVAAPRLPPPTRTARADALELLASMRFAIALLTVICIASAIGTILQQGQALVNYVDAFGPYWAEVFGALGLFRIYSAPWFLVILAFLVISTSLCIARNAPKIVADVRTFKEHLRVRSLDAFHHRAQGRVDGPLQAARDQALNTLKTLGWQVRTEDRLAAQDGPVGIMIAARRGTANKLGYLAAHSAIVLVCLGGLFDGEMVAKVQAWWGGLEPFRGGTETERSRLSVDNPAYRAQLFVPEGERSSAAVLNLQDGMLVQPLPFEVELKKFIVDYYSTGMPKRFASEIVVHDARDGSSHPATVEVNKPFVYDGITIFQSSFEDGGSQVVLRPVPLAGQPAMPGLLLNGTVGAQGVPLPPELTPGGRLSLELTALRTINVEDLSKAEGGSQAAAGNDVRGVNLQVLTEHLGSGAKAPGAKQLVNIGPSITYKLRDAAGQAHEFQNYMVPVNLGGQAVFLLGVRSAPSEPFRFLRVPADDQMQLTGWLRLRQALNEPALREEAVRRFVAQGAPDAQSEAAQQLALSARRVLELYAGEPGAAGAGARAAGFQALSEFIDQVVPEPERERTAATLIRILNGVVFELLNVGREADGLKPLSADDAATRDFMSQAVLSLSDVHAYPAPLILMPDSFEQRQASVFQVTRTPGRNVVYLGCALLILGVFAMLYVRERRVWVWLQPAAEGPGVEARMALSSTRQTLDTDAEFERLRQLLLPGAPSSADTPAQKGQVLP